MLRALNLPTLGLKRFCEIAGPSAAAAGLPLSSRAAPAPTPLPPRGAQLVDLWTTGTDPAEYVQFLDTLLEQATHAPPHHRRAAAPPHHCRTAAPPHRRPVLRRYTSATPLLGYCPSR